MQCGTDAYTESGYIGEKPSETWMVLWWTCKSSIGLKIFYYGILFRMLWVSRLFSATLAMLTFPSHYLFTCYIHCSSPFESHFSAVMQLWYAKPINKPSLNLLSSHSMLLLEWRHDDIQPKDFTQPKGKKRKVFSHPNSVSSHIVKFNYDAHIDHMSVKLWPGQCEISLLQPLIVVLADFVAISANCLTQFFVLFALFTCISQPIELFTVWMRRCFNFNYDGVVLSA